jgi:hypothetical protein
VNLCPCLRSPNAVVLRTCGDLDFKACRMSRTRKSQDRGYFTAFVAVPGVRYTSVVIPQERGKSKSTRFSLLCERMPRRPLLVSDVSGCLTWRSAQREASSSGTSTLLRGSHIPGVLCPRVVLSRRLAHNQPTAESTQLPVYPRCARLRHTSTYPVSRSLTPLETRHSAAIHRVHVESGAMPGMVAVTRFGV